MYRTFATALLAATLGGGSTAIADDGRWLTPTMINARADFMNPALNYLTFQHIDTMFATRPVSAGKTVWELPSQPADIGNSFSFGGKTHSLEEFLEATSASALLVIQDGKIIHEAYRNGSSEQTRFISFSMAKSLLANMVGIAIGEGKIKGLNAKVVDYLPDWKGTAYADVTILNLLQMQSGVDWLEVYEFGSDTQLTKVHDNSLVAYKYRWCDFAKNEAKTATDPGTTFNYSTLDTSVLGCVLEAAVGTKGADYFSQKIWQPAGMEADGFYLLDGPDSVGREFYGAGFNATLRDYGRIGLMMLNGGAANGTQVIPADWVKVSTTAPEGSPLADEVENLGYGYQWWTVAGTNAYSAYGLFNQHIYVNPDTKTVIVKLAAPASPLGYGVDNFAFFAAVAENASRH
jgi:CubicO group peptidase (beta-lactamase class C family)